MDRVLSMRETHRRTVPGAVTAMDVSSHPLATATALDFTRDGQLTVVEGEAEGPSRLGARLLELLRLAPARARPDLVFGREVARRVLAAIAARGVADEEALVTPAQGELGELLAAASAIMGRSLLDEQVLATAWSAVAAAACQEAQAGGMAAYLEGLGVDPELGRLHVHLAERRHGGDHPFAFLATIATCRGADGRVQHVPLHMAIAELESDASGQQRLLAPLRRAGARNAAIAALVDSHEVFHAVAWTAAEAYALLRAVPDLQAAGIRVHVPDWWHAAPPSPQLRVQLGAGAPVSLGLDALLDFKLGWFIGADELSTEEWQHIARGEAGLHRFRGRWIELDPERHAEAMRQWESLAQLASRGNVDFAEGMRLLAAQARERSGADRHGVTVTPGPWLARTMDQLVGPASDAAADPGPALRGNLRPYQRDGVAWLWLLARLGLGGCLADDMGLGKTIQVIALLLLLQQRRVPGPHLVVVPASLLGNWCAELERFAPSLRVYVAHRTTSGTDGQPATGTADIVLTTYATLSRLPWPLQLRWGLIVLDEAQAIKNAESRQTRAVKLLTGRLRLALTGTPVENSLADLWSIFDFINPGLLGGADEFRKLCRPLGADSDEIGPLRRLVRPYILRRLKSDRSIIADLPDKTEMQVYCGLTRVQAGLYEQTVRALAREASGADGVRRRGVILGFLTRLKQICNHPSQYSGDGKYAPEDSAKFMRLQELCGSIAVSGDKVLVFTQFREMCGPLAGLLAGSFGRPGLVFHGGLSVRRRIETVAEFQGANGPPFLVVSLKAGGTGLNLTEAAHVVHFDRWWNPAVENQATDRAYRIGQHKNVLVHKFVCRGTLEEHIDALLRGKQGLADNVLDQDGERRLTELGTEDLLRAVALDLRTAVEDD